MMGKAWHGVVVAETRNWLGDLEANPSYVV
jgi:hypothetical protein